MKHFQWGLVASFIANCVEIRTPKSMYTNADYVFFAKNRNIQKEAFSVGIDGIKTVPRSLVKPVFRGPRTRPKIAAYNGDARKVARFFTFFWKIIPFLTSIFGRRSQNKKVKLRMAMVFNFAFFFSNFVKKSRSDMHFGTFCTHSQIDSYQS